MMSSTLRGALSFSEGLVEAFAPLDKCILQAVCSISASPQARMHHARHLHVLVLNTAGSWRDWLNARDSPLQSEGPQASTTHLADICQETRHSNRDSFFSPYSELPTIITIADISLRSASIFAAPTTHQDQGHTQRSLPKEGPFRFIAVQKTFGSVPGPFLLSQIVY